MKPNVCCKGLVVFLGVVITVIAVALAAYETANWLAVYWGEMMMSPMSNGPTRYPYDHLPLPSVTFCPRSLTNATASYMEDNQRLYALSLSMPSANPDILAAVNTIKAGWTDSFMTQIRTQFLATLQSQNVAPIQVYLNLGYQCQGFVQSCKVGKRVFDCCQDSFLTSTYFGPCITIRPNQYQTQPGIQDKMEIRLQVDSANFLNVKFLNGTFTGYPGFWMFLDADGYFLNDPMFIRTGSDTYVNVKSQRGGHMSAPWTHLPFKDQSCLVAPSDFRPQFDSQNIFMEANNDIMLKQQNSQRDMVEGCRRQCLSDKIYAKCNCYPFGLMTSNTQVPTRTFCETNTTLSCVMPLLNGTELLPAWIAQTAASMPLQLVCDTQCPSLCGAERIVAVDVRQTDLHTSFYPEISTYSMASAAVISVYYSRWDYTDSPPPDLNLYQLLRQVGLTLVIWLAVAAFLVLFLLALKGLLCCSCCNCGKGQRFNNAVDPQIHLNGNGNVEMRQVQQDGVVA